MATKKKLDITKLGRYKIISELGRGAMGVVYKGEDPALDRTVALKTVILSDDALGKAEYQKRFFLEAKAAGRLSHPQIITVYDFGQEGDFAYMAMERSPLRQRLGDRWGETLVVRASFVPEARRGAFRTGAGILLGFALATAIGTYSVVMRMAIGHTI